MKRGYQTVMAIVALLMAPAAIAHTFGAHGAGFAAGLAHPFTGPDHLLAMLAVGVWATQLGGQVCWRVPLTFLTVMALGSALAAAGMPLAGVEAGIAVSVLTLGLLIAAAVRFPLRAGLLLAGAFALFHGYAHGLELAPASAGFGYIPGFLLATGVLHAAGVGLGVLLGRGENASHGVRALGGGIAAAGVVIWAWA